MLIDKSYPLIPSFKTKGFVSLNTLHYPIEYAVGHLDANLVENGTSMERVVIIGSSGSGKSTLARTLGEKTGLPVVHLDLHFWHPGWIGTPDPIWQEKMEAIVKPSKWIIDGNYRRTLDIRLQAADTVIFLDLPRWVCAWRAVKRRIEYRHKQRPDMAAGCQETLFAPDFPDFLVRIWQYPDRARPDILRHLSRLDGQKRMIHLRSSAEMQRFVAAPLAYAEQTPLRQMTSHT